GTEFKLFFPCAPASAIPAQTATPAPKPKRLGTVLLVESDDRQRGLARYTLDWHGYKVIEADGSSTALMLWEKQAATVDLVIIDTSLSGDVSGTDLALRLQQAKPGIPILCTARTEADEKSGCIIPAGAHLFAKPFTPEKLLPAVRQLTGK